MPKKIKRRVSRAEPSLDWQFPDEEAWLVEQTNGAAPPAQPQTQRWGLPEQRVLLLLLILISAVYGLWSATQREEQSKTILPLLMTQDSPNDSVEHNLSTPFSDAQQRTQPLSPLTLVGANDSTQEATPGRQPEPICFWSHIACNTNP